MEIDRGWGDDGIEMMMIMKIIDMGGRFIQCLYLRKYHSDLLKYRERI